MRKKDNNSKFLINEIFMKMIITSLIVFFLGVIGLVIFSINDVFIFSPAIYVLMIIMGLGWGATAITMKLTRK